MKGAITLKLTIVQKFFGKFEENACVLVTFFAKRFSKKINNKYKEKNRNGNNQSVF